MAVTRGLGKRASSTEEELKTLRRYLEQFDDVDFVRARPVKVVFSPFLQLVKVTHGLGRPYVGAVCVGTTFAIAAGTSTAAIACVAPPEQAAGSGVDISVYALFFLSAFIADEVTANFRVF